MKCKNHMVTSIDAEKTSDIIQHPFMIKIIIKVDIEATYLNILKAFITNTQLTSYSMVKR